MTGKATRFSKWCMTLAAVLVLAGCTQHRPPEIGRSVEEVYGEVNREGARDAVSLVRDGLRSQQTYGTTDPYVPLRKPAQVVPVWVPPYVDPRTGRRVAGHWEHTVIKESEWALD